MRIGILTPRSTGSDGEVCRVAVAQERELQRLGHEVVMGEDSLRSRACEILHVFHGGDELPSIPAPEEGAPPTVLFAHGEVDSGLRSIIDRLDRVVVPSRLHLVRLADELEFKPLQVRLLEPGLDLELPSQHRRPRPWSGSGPLQLLVLGGREDREGLISLARAVATLPAGSVRLTVPGPRDLLFDELLEGLVGEESFHACGVVDEAGLASLAADCHLAVFPSTRPESYALPVDVAVALGLPVWASGAEAALERYDAGALELLPAGDPDTWSLALREWLDEPRLTRDAFRALPDAVPTAADSAATLERWDQELLTEFRARPRRRTPNSGRDRHRPA